MDICTNMALEHGNTVNHAILKEIGCLSHISFDTPTVTMTTALHHTQLNKNSCLFFKDSMMWQSDRSPTLSRDSEEEKEMLKLPGTPQSLTMYIKVPL